MTVKSSFYENASVYNAINGAQPYVITFNGRSGAVVPAAGDYTASQITNVPAGDVLSTDVQAAINELSVAISAVSGGAVSAADVSNVPAGNIASTDVQAALNELDTEKQPKDADLTALAALSSTGLVSRTGSNTFSTRTLTAPAAGITVSNGDGVSGDPTLVLANDLSALEGLASTGLATRTASDTWAQRTLTAPSAGLTISNPAGVAGNPTFALANDLAAIEGLAANGMIARTATDTMTVRTITAPAAGITVSNGDGVSGNPTLALANDLAALEGLAANGLVARTATDTMAARTLTGPAAGISVSNGDGVSGNPTLALTNDLSALEGLSSTGIARRTGTDAWSVGTLVTNAELANVSTATFKGRTTAGSGAPEDLTATQATALLNAMVGDSGSGGTKGLVPAPASGDAAASKFLKADGTWATTAGGGLSAATQAEQEAGSSTSAYTSPGRQQFHPSAAKFWCSWGVTTTIDESYNMTSITDNGTGDWTLTIATDFSTSTWAAVGTAYGAISNGFMMQFSSATAKSVTAIRVAVYDITPALADPTKNYVVGFGDQ